MGRQFVESHKAAPLTEPLRGSFLRETKGGELIFRKPISDSVALLVFSLFVLASPALEWVWGMADSRSPTGTADTITVWLLGFLLISFRLTAGITLFCISFPCETYINIEQRTFKHVTRRWLWGRKILCGSLDEMAGVCVTGRGNVLLALKRHRGQLYAIELGKTDTRENSAGLAQQFSSVLDLPLIEVPWYK